MLDCEGILCCDDAQSRERPTLVAPVSPGNPDAFETKEEDSTAVGPSPPSPDTVIELAEGFVLEPEKTLTFLEDQVEGAESAFEEMLASTISGAETTAKKQVLDALTHGLSFAAGFSWVAVAWSLATHSFSVDPSEENAGVAWLQVAAAVVVGLPVMLALSRRAAALGERADAALKAGDAEAALVLRTRASGVKALGTSGVAAVLAGLTDGAINASLMGNHWGWGAVRCLVLVVLVAALTAGLALGGARAFGTNNAAALAVAESVCASAAYLVALGVISTVTSALALDDISSSEDLGGLAVATAVCAVSAVGVTASLLVADKARARALKQKHQYAAATAEPGSWLSCCRPA